MGFATLAYKKMKGAWGAKGYGKAGAMAAKGWGAPAYGAGGKGKAWASPYGSWDAGKGKGKGFGKSMGKKPRGPSGPDLERERLTAEKFSGEVIEWKGKFGYIQPSEEIEHPDAQKHGGKLWFSIKDCPDQAELAVGTAVAFHVYSDSSGTLGAEEIDA